MQLNIVFLLPCLFFLFAVYQLDDRRFPFISLFAVLYFCAFLLPFLLPQNIYSQWMALYSNHPTVFSALLMGKIETYAICLLGLMGLYFGLVLANSMRLVSTTANLHHDKADDEQNSALVGLGMLGVCSTLLFVFELNDRSQMARAAFELPMVMSIVLLIRNDDSKHRLLGLVGLSGFCLLAIFEMRVTKLAFVVLLFFLFQLKLQQIRWRIISLSGVAVFLFLVIKPLARRLQKALKNDQEFSGLFLDYAGQFNQNFFSLVMGAFDRVFSASAMATVTVANQPPNPSYLHAGLWSLVPGSLVKSKPAIYETGQSFGHDFGFLADFDMTTAINLPATVQFYLVAGSFGVFFGMFCLAILITILSWQIANVDIGKSNSIFLACGLNFLAHVLFTLDRSISTIGGGALVSLFTFGALVVVTATSNHLCRLWNKLFLNRAL
jgi:hypothetical protein